MYRIDELEDAIVSTAITAGYDAKPMNRRPLESEFAKEVGEKPLVLVVFEKCEKSATNFTMHKGTDFTFRFFVATRNMSGQTIAERGDVISTGIYAVLNGLRVTFDGSSLGLTAQPMVWLSEKAELRSGRLSVYSQDWKISVYE